LDGNDTQGAETAETEQPEQERRRWYVVHGTERPHLSLDELYRVRTKQIRDVPLEYLEPIVEHDPFNRNPDAWSLGIGREVTDWLSVEILGHGMQATYSVASSTDVSPTTMADTPYPTTADQRSTFQERTYSLTFLPRWDINRFVGIYGRLGVGFANNRFDSTMSTVAVVPNASVVLAASDCAPDEITGEHKCTRIVDDIHDIDTGFFPIVGIGIQFAECVRLEYMVRSDVPIGNTTTDISADLYLSFEIKKYWWLEEKQ
jgi:opacity protein-like surface antigen